MPRRQIVFRSGECYHVYNRGNNREPIFFEPDNYAFFLRKMREYLVIADSPENGSAHPAEILAYCLMPNHFHLLVRLCSDEFSRAMQSLGQSYTNAINKRRNRVGPLFQGRFQAIHVDRDSYLVHLSRYIHLNPVEASLVQRAEDWAFSSYPEYIGLRQGSLPRLDVVLSQFTSVDANRQFVEEKKAGFEQIKGLLIDDDDDPDAAKQPGCSKQPGC